MQDPGTRREAVLSAVELFLRDNSIRQEDDTTTSKILTDIVFSSEKLILSDPAFVRRQGTLVVVGLPDGMGIFLYDLSATSTRPLQVSSWTVGLSSVDVTWAGNELGINYITISGEQASWVHYVMCSKSDIGWQVMWFSDEQPDWWFNSRNATISIAPYLSRLTITGEAEGSTSIFVEEGDVPRRTFKVEWLRDQEHYRLPLTTNSQQDRQQWIWQTAQPSSYATLVEFIEQIRLHNTREAGDLTCNSTVVTSAFSFGLHLPDVRYKVTAYHQESITFQSQQGAFVATFRPPGKEGEPWLISALKPLGATDTINPAKSR